MRHTDTMLRRLPQLYREGALLRQVLEQPGVQLEVLDEEALEVQRAHWFNASLHLDEAAGLAALLDLAPESWQTLREFRPWVHALRDAMLRHGAVTPRALREFVQRYVNQVASRDLMPEIGDADWTAPPSPTRAAWVENPPRRRYETAAGIEGVEPLCQFSITQRGLDEADAAFLLVGLRSAPESVPVIANVTTGQALIFLGNIKPGERLWLRPAADHHVEGWLEGRNVTSQLRSVAGLVPGKAWAPAEAENPARAVTLTRGENQLWFLPVAHFDQMGLDRFLLALADLVLRQGRYDGTQFDQALFFQDPAVLLRVTWVETEPASFEVRLPGGTLRSPPGQRAAAEEQRERVRFSLEQSVQRLRAAGVKAAVRLRPFAEMQAQMDRLVAVMPMVHRETGPTGADALPDAGGVFTVTQFEESTFR